MVVGVSRFVKEKIVSGNAEQFSVGFKKIIILDKNHIVLPLSIQRKRMWGLQLKKAWDSREVKLLEIK